MSLWPGKGMISLAELGQYSQTSAKVLKGMIERGELRAVRLGREWRIPRAEAFRVLGLRDPEGPAAAVPLATRLPPRPQLSPAEEATVLRFVNR